MTKSTSSVNNHAPETGPPTFESSTDIDIPPVNNPVGNPGNSTVNGAVGREAPVDMQPPQHRRRIAVWQAIIIGILLVFIWFLITGLRRQYDSEQRADGEAPQLEFVTFEGETIRLADLKGRGVVLNFWASWCDPCRAEAELLEQTWRREQDKGIVFIGLDYLDQKYAAEAYLEEFQVSYPNGPDLQSRWARRYGIKGVPETFFISPDGMIESHIIGPVISAADLDQRLDAIRPIP